MADTTPPASAEVPEPDAAASNAAAAGAAPTTPPPASPYAQPYAQQPYAVGPKTNTLAIVSLVLSIIGVSIGGVITGHIALKQIKERGEAGHGLALAGAIIGWVGCAFWVIAIVLTILSFVLFGTALWGVSTYDYGDYNY
jgi:hypothetical protein